MNVAIKGINDHFSELARRKLAEQQAAADARDALAAQAADFAKQREDDHGPALLMNAAFDMARVKDAADDLTRCAETAQSMLINGRSLIMSVEAYVDAGLADEELTNEEITAMGAECGLTKMQWVERLDLYVMWARSQPA